MEFFGGEALIFNKILFRDEQGKITFSRNYSGVNLYSCGVGTYFTEVLKSSG